RVAGFVAMAQIGIVGCSNGGGANGDQTTTITRAVGGSICPAVGADTDCGIVIELTNGRANLTFTGQGPYDTADDTLVGIVNNDVVAIQSIKLRSTRPIFGFDGDGICGTNPLNGRPFVPRPANCPFGLTGYEGPGVIFSDISPDGRSGTVNFRPALAARG